MQNTANNGLIVETDHAFENRHMKRWLHELVSDHPDFQVLGEPAEDTYCFRYIPNTLVERQADVEIQGLLDRLNQQIVESVQRIGLNSVTTASVDGLVAIQISCRSNVAVTFEAVARWGRLLNMKRSATE
jgi:hypothetical protein